MNYANYFFGALSSVIWKSPTASDEPLVIDGQRCYGLENRMKLPMQCWGANGTLADAQKLSIKLSLAEDHPLNQKIRQASTIQRQHPEIKAEYAEELMWEDNLVRSQVSDVASNTVFYQLNLTLEETKKRIRENGENFTKLVMNDLDDELMKLITEKCAQLQSFSLVKSLKGFPMEHFSDKGFESIAELKKLTTLNLWMDNAYYISTDAMQKVLRNAHFHDTLEVFTIASYFTKEMLNECIKFKNLTELGISVFSFEALPLDRLLKESHSKATLQKIQLNFSPLYVLDTPFTDAMLKHLSEYIHLSSLGVTATWKVQETVVVSTLQALTKLEHLSFCGPLNLTSMTAVAQEIGQHHVLKSLSLGDCHALMYSDYPLFIHSSMQLKSLFLNKAYGLGMYGNMRSLGTLSQLSTLSLSDYRGIGGELPELFKFENIQNLQSISLSNDIWTLSSHWKKITELKVLTLRISNCAKFNDPCFEALANSSLAGRLQGLELNNVSISKNTIGGFSKFTNLNTLMICTINAVVETGIYEFLSLPNLQQSLRRYSLYNISLSKKELELLADYPNLEVLIVGNAFSFNNKEELKMFFHLKNIKHAQTELYEGEIVPYSVLVSV